MQKNIPIGSSRNIPLVSIEHCRRKGIGSDGGNRRRRYTKAEEINELSVDKYIRSHKGITYNDLIRAGIASHKLQAQLALKRCKKKDILFTPENHKPQHYYPSSLKSEILKAKMSKNVPMNPTGVGYFNRHHSSPQGQDHDESIIRQTLHDYVLPMLPKAPLFIHNMHFKLKISPECYHELGLPSWQGNHGKHHPDIIGNVRVDYVFYANGTVDVHTQTSENPHRLETDADRSILLVFFGQLRDRLVTFLMDKHERLVPEIMNWELTECDINKDIKVSDSLHVCGIKMQVKHLDRLFSIYIKSMGKNTVCRVEERKSLKHVTVIESINRIFNQSERNENHNLLEYKLDQIILEIKRSRFVHILGSCYGGFTIY